MGPTRSMTVTKVEGRETQRVEDVLVREQRVLVRLGDRTILDTVCTPGQTGELAYGHLISEGWIRALRDVSVITVDPNASVSIQLREGRDVPRREPETVAGSYAVAISDLLRAAEDAEAQGLLFRATGGTHLAAIFPVGGPSVIAEDISRTCALEKALGKALLGGIDFGRSVLSLTSRVPRSFVHKAAHVGIPIIAAVSAPTYDAVEEAERLGICLCGFVRKGRLNVYSQLWRVGLR